MILWSEGEKFSFFNPKMWPLNKAWEIVVIVERFLQSVRNFHPFQRGKKLNWEQLWHTKAHTQTCRWHFQFFNFSLPPSPMHVKNVAKMFLIFCFHSLFEHHFIVGKALRWKSEKCASKKERKTQKPLSITQFVEKNFNDDIPIPKWRNLIFSCCLVTSEKIFYSKLNKNGVSCADDEVNCVQLTFIGDYEQF